MVHSQWPPSALWPSYSQAVVPGLPQGVPKYNRVVLPTRSAARMEELVPILTTLVALAVGYFLGGLGNGTAGRGVW